MPNLRRVGAVAEDRAADYLIGLGYTLVTRRYKARHGEIDVIALDGETLVFVEVKARHAGGDPEASIGDAKLGSMGRAASQYRIETEQTDRDWRFDIIAIDRTGLRHHIDVLAH